MIDVLIGLASGAIGGNVAGGVMKSNMGTMGRSLTGIVGGVVLSLIGQRIPGLEGMFSMGGDFSLAGVVGPLVSGGLGGGILTAILGKLKK